jgi:hypothetical protein
LNINILKRLGYSVLLINPKNALDVLTFVRAAVMGWRLETAGGAPLMTPRWMEDAEDDVIFCFVVGDIGMC